MNYIIFQNDTETHLILKSVDVDYSGNYSCHGIDKNKNIFMETVVLKVLGM